MYLTIVSASILAIGLSLFILVALISIGVYVVRLIKYGADDTEPISTRLRKDLRRKKRGGRPIEQVNNVSKFYNKK